MPTVKYTTIRVILAFVAYYDWELKQSDFKIAFLHGDFNEKIFFFNQPKGFESKYKPDRLYFYRNFSMS